MILPANVTIYEAELATFMALKDPIPMHVFATEQEAREWLKQYL